MLPENVLLRNKIPKSTAMDNSLQPAYSLQIEPDLSVADKKRNALLLKDPFR